ncbi:MAG: hypothetical protein QM770_03555 [Tepidisphaeraceae bacterium]
MSVLTKIFVVLLVVLSLVLSAATVVYVASQEANASALENLKTANAALEARNRSLEASHASPSATLLSANSSLRQELDAARTELKKKDLDLAQAKSDIAARDGQIQLLTSVKESDSKLLAAATSRADALQTQYNESLEKVKNLTAELGTTNTQLATAQKESAFASAAARETSEINVELKAQIDRLSGALKDLGRDPSKVIGGVAAGAPSINGVVSQRLDIGGVPYAKISVGSDDAVTIGMQFNILDRSSGAFLGKLTVRQVNPNEAIGSLEGPQVQSVKEGNEVRTSNS